MKLTNRQRQVLLALWETGSAKRAGVAVGISDKTVENHLRRVRERMNALDHSYIDLCRWGVRIGILSLVLCITSVEARKPRPPQPVTTSVFTYWPGVPGAVSYDVVCGGRTNITFGTNEVITGLAIGLTYHVYVQAVGSSGVRSSPSCAITFVAGTPGTNACPANLFAYGRH